MKLHSLCTNGNINSPASFFCINNITGRIYTTSDFLSADITTTTRFHFTINVVDPAHLLEGEKNFTVNLSFNDKCANNQYEKLSNCVNYDAITASGIDEKVTVRFVAKKRYQNIASITLNQYINLTRVAAEVTVTDSEGLIVSSKNTSFVSFASNGNKPLIDLNIRGVEKEYVVKVQFMQYSNQTKQTKLVEVDEMSPSLFMLIGIVSYKCDSTCIVKYQQWRNEAKIQAAKQGCALGLADQKRYGLNFDKCLG